MIAFGCTLVRRDFTFDAAFESAALITGLIGPSGSGKTTLVNLIAGLLTPSRGRIAIGGTVLTDTERGIMLPPHLRGVGLVFQDALLFPHLSVHRNLTYARDVGRVSAGSISFDAVTGVLGIGHLLDRAPHTLSGGERQRIAIGRALLASPRILLMDEPLASLDSARKFEILTLIEHMRDEFSIPILYVSHAREEVARLASVVVKLDHGRVEGVGPTSGVLD